MKEQYEIDERSSRYRDINVDKLIYKNALELVRLHAPQYFYFL